MSIAGISAYKSPLKYCGRKEMEKTRDGRIAWIDVAKGIGILLIVFGHTMQSGFVRQVIFSFHVPFFFFLSGVTYKREASFYTFIRKRIVGLLVPYWVWGIISIAVFLLMGHFLHLKEADTGLLNNIFGLLYGNPRTELMWWNRPLWFIPCLFITLLIVDVTERYLLAKNRGGRKIRIAVIAFSLFLGVIWNKASDFVLPFHLEASLGMIAFTEMGIMFRDCRIDKQIEKTCVGVKTAVIIICIIAGVFFSSINGWAQVLRCTYGKYPGLYIVTSVLLITAVTVFTVSVGKNFVFEELGKQSMCILLMHKFPVLAFQRIIPVTKGLLSESRPESPITVACGVVVSGICIGLCLLAGNVIGRFLPEIIGQRRDKEKLNSI